MPRMLLTLLLSATLCIASFFSIVPQAHASGLIDLAEAITETVDETIESTKNEALKDADHAHDFYFAQAGSGRCTITSIAMMVKRAAFLDDDENWQSIGAASVTADGWTSAGAKNEFVTAGYSVSYVSLDNDKQALIQMLEEHPEGIAAYDPSVPHAVLLTDYEEETDTFYCADPASYYSGARIPVTSSWNGACRGSQASVIAGFTRAWIIEG